MLIVPKHEFFDYHAKYTDAGECEICPAPLPEALLEEVRKNVGPWFPIIVRISAEERVPGGNTLEDTLEYLEYLDEYVDMYDVSCGLNPSLQYQIDSNFLPDGWRSYMARAVKDKFKKPVINAGNYRDPKVVEKVLESGDVDIVGMGRGLIAEPNWVKKVENGEEDLLRKCISCNVGCAGNRIGVNRPIRCTVNPAVPEGDIYKALKVNKNCNVVVVGAGTAGMEAACTAAEVGCNVFVLEKNDHIGGLCERQKCLAPLLRFQIHHDGALVAVHVQKPEAVIAFQLEAHGAAGLVAGRRLDLDHIRAQIAQHHAAERPGHDLRDIQNPDSFQRKRPFGCAHGVTLRRSDGPAAARCRACRCR